MAKSVKALIVVVGLGFLGWLVLTYLVVKPFSTDLSVIGEGKPVVVLVHESYMPAGMEAMERLNQVRGAFESDIKFRVADLGTPDGKTFASLHDVFDGAMVLLDAQGEPVRITLVPESIVSLKQEIERLR
ncbi:hypothetical protein [Nitrincola nitratireducens]|uniref:DUF4174 domain-containing protein n=1 Tax=Nitrincola nitratireducens TaxID=1229521 RepID=W9UVV0_9GAMM|nr:hypothetical protein [Nitrincola nitratireducens]EXJ11353.1 hypothetical protein D791_01808 [Nitrincola nitratireducens]